MASASIASCYSTLKQPSKRRRSQTVGVEIHSVPRLNTCSQTKALAKQGGVA